MSRQWLLVTIVGLLLVVAFLLGKASGGTTVNVDNGGCKGKSALQRALSC